MMVATQNLLVLSVERREMGLATSLSIVFRNVGSSLGAPIAGSLLSTFVVTYLVGTQHVTLPSNTAFEYAYYIAVVGFAVSFLLAFFAREVIGKAAYKETIID